jgi:parvulin-like peptidyl-prolyl isomerase
VDGEPVTRAEVELRLRAARGGVDPTPLAPHQQDRVVEAALESEILARLLYRAARAEDWEVDDAELEAALERAREMLGADGFARMLAQRQATAAEFREFLAAQQLVRRYRAKLFADIEITPADLESYYAGHRETFRVSDSARLAVLAAPDSATARQVHARMQAGETADALAAEIPGLELRRTRWMPYEALPPELAQRVPAAAAGELLEPVQHGERFLVVRVLGTRPAGQLTFDEVREDIRRRLLDLRRQEILRDWFDLQRQEVPIEYAGGSAP